MNHETMLAIAEKIKNQTATQEDIEMFAKAFAEMTEELKNELKD
ncbi:MAG: hypothetical protein NT165_01950 [Candidatus Falkowbacteria bacterium]|nr:hypothetical protein [Candidatus Falkowbacteria bacterium]